VVPLSVPVTVIPDSKVALPLVSVSPEKVKSPPKVWLTANRSIKLPLVKLAVVPVIVTPDSVELNVAVFPVI
jgi:hypothetical protein